MHRMPQEIATVATAASPFRGQVAFPAKVTWFA